MEERKSIEVVSGDGSNLDISPVYEHLNESTPKKYKAMIIGALGYFILPIDMIPDFIPVVGYSDDIAAIAGVIFAVVKCVSPEIKAQAKAKLKEWFGEYDELEIADVIH